MRHAGIHFPENAGGEHPNRQTIVSMPGIRNGCSLICSPSARFHYGYVRQNCSGVVVWRAIPRQGKLPAQLKWNPEAVAEECLNLWDEQPENAPQHHYGIEHFLPLNELQFVKENGANFPGYGEMANNLARLLPALRREFERRGQTVRLHFPAWVPMDEGDHLEDWAWAAEQWDVIHLHAYGSAETQRARYRSYRARFPHHPIFVGEHNANHEGHDERATLEMWAEETARDPLLIGVTYYIWETLNAGERDLSIWGNGDRYALFLNPPPEQGQPTPSEPAPQPEPIPVRYDPWKFFTPEQLAEAAQVPEQNARLNWPRLVEQSGHAGILDGQSDDVILNTYVGLIGTIAKESASTFLPVREAFFLGEPEPAETYRRNNLRYYPYYGRGYIQITWEENYATYGRLVAELWQADPSHPDFDLVGNPDQALDPDISAAISVLYFRDHANGALLHAARTKDWEGVRRLVLGGSDPDGVRRIQRVDSMLSGAAPEEPGQPTTPAAIPFNPDAPIDIQPDDWSCSLQSVQWLLRSIGRNPDASDPHGDPWLKSELVPHIVSPDVGLRKATGEDLANWLNRQYGQEMGFIARYAEVTFDDVLAGAGTNPMIAGGRRYGPGGHWVGIRRADENGWLELANPAPNYTNTGTHLDRDEWDARGPWSVIWIDRMSDAPQQPSEPQPEPEPTTPPIETPEQERARLIEAIGYVGGDLADRLEQARASMDDDAERANAGMSAAESRSALVKLWANVDRVYAELGAIGDELRRVRKQQLG